MKISCRYILALLEGQYAKKKKISSVTTSNYKITQKKLSLFSELTNKYIQNIPPSVIFGNRNCIRNENFLAYIFHKIWF